MKKLLQFFFPPAQWQRTVIILLGIICGLFIFIIYISNAPSYLSDRPETCINCHVMYPQYASWQHSSHALVANCNDCHVPHDNFVNKYFFKAKDGIRHASIFTLRMEPQVIKIKEAGQSVVQENCKRCHADMVSMISLTEVTYENSLTGKGHKCWDCHASVPHGEVNSLAAYPFSSVPGKNLNVPLWLKKHLENQNKKEQKVTK